MRFSKRREIWLTELFRALGWLSLFHFLKQPPQFTTVTA